jgi:hypothetical protein
MKKLPIDVSSFPTLLRENYVYIDKTEHIYNLITSGRLYFLSRPRRFGKSLLLSTLAELFAGNKELFKGLWIYENSTYDWPECPVIHLDFSRLSFGTPQELKTSLSWAVTHIAKSFGIDVSDAPFAGEKIQVLVEELYKRNKVVILIDEYDYPIINSILHIETVKANRDVLRQFFSTIKSLDEYLGAFFLTGVSKFSKTSIFSGLNNLNDITMDPIASVLLGYTREEILHAFSEHINTIAQEMGKSSQEVLQGITEWYNGYRFSEKEQLVYNPFSVLYLLQKKKFDDYWFASGTPSFLMNLLKDQYREMIDISDIGMPSENLGSFEVENIPLIPILYQTGYLTIKEYDPKKNLYKLDFPNREVRGAFNKYLLATFAGSDPSAVKSAIPRLMSALSHGDVALFMSLLQILFAHIPYQLHIPLERYYHSLFQLLASILTHDTQSEISTDKGRIDLVIKMNGITYLFEIKLDGTAEQALRQIEDRKYHERYLLQKNRIILVGMSFNRLVDRLSIDYLARELPN